MSFVRRWSRALEPEAAFRLPWRQQYDRARRFVVRTPPESEQLQMQLCNPLLTSDFSRSFARSFARSVARSFAIPPSPCLPFLLLRPLSRPRPPLSY